MEGTTIDTNKEFFVSKHYRGSSAGEAYDKFSFGAEETTLTPTSSTTSLTPENALYHASLTHEMVQRDLEEEAKASQHQIAAEYLKPLTSPLRRIQPRQQKERPSFVPVYLVSRLLEPISRYMRHGDSPSTWIGFWAMLLVTCANYVLQPMRDAIALAVGVQHIPKLTLASTVLAVVSSVPIGWLFEAPDPQRRKLWKRMGLTRGETQGTSLALFYRTFAFFITSYAIGFKLVDHFSTSVDGRQDQEWSLYATIGKFMYIAFFLVVHIMKLHSLSLVWGVTTEAMEYEEVAQKRMGNSGGGSKSRLKRMAYVGFGGTLGGILGSLIASSLARVLQLSGLLAIAALLLEASAELSIELGRIMQKHWEEQKLFMSTDNLSSLDASMKRSVSTGSMKRVASGNSLHKAANHKSFSDLANAQNKSDAKKSPSIAEADLNEDSFMQRLQRGIKTILRSRLLMAIFTYNALYASTTVLLSFQRAALVANRNTTSSTESDTAFLANINMASSIAVFVLQLSGAGAFVAHTCGPRGTLAIMPLFRLLGVFALVWWHQNSNGQPPNLILFLLLDECTRVMNLAVAKPVRESLWRGLSNEARYEAKPIVDTLANRWGGGSAAFLVSLTDKILDVIGVGFDINGGRTIFGLPPILFLCMIVASWWAMVSADLGNIRRRIDLELKKQQ